MLRAGSVKDKEILDAKEQTSNSKLHVNKKQEIVSPSENLENQVERYDSVSSNSMTVLKHLSSAQKVENISGITMEQEPILAAEAMPTLDKVISELNVINPTYQNTGMMHLHCVRNVDEGLGMEEPRPGAHQPEEHEQYTLDISSQADHALKMTNNKAEVMQGTLVSKNYELVHYWNNFLGSHSFIHSVFNDSTSSIMHLIFSLSAKEETGTLGVNKDQEQLKEDVVKIATTSDQTSVSDHLIQSVYHDSKDVVTHLICSEELGKGICTMEKHPEPNSRHTPKEWSMKKPRVK